MVLLVIYLKMSQELVNSMSTTSKEQQLEDRVKMLEEQVIFLLQEQNLLKKRNEKGVDHQKLLEENVKEFSEAF